MKKIVGALSLLALLLVGGAAQAEWKNVQVLPKDMPKDALKKIMKAQSKALGKDCDFCHEQPRMDTDTDKKRIAREMMLMVEEINKKFLTNAKSKATCATCHRGKEKPEA